MLLVTPWLYRTSFSPTPAYSEDTEAAPQEPARGLAHCTYSKATDHIILPKGLTKVFELPIFSLQPSSIVAIRKLILT